MKIVNLGSQGLRVSAQGLGAMGMSLWYGRTDEREATLTLQRALDLGVTFIDTAEAYAANESLVGRAINGRRHEVALATKVSRGHPDYVAAAADRSLAALRTDVIDLYYLHRVDPDVPIEETVGAMAGLVAAGKVRSIGLSEAAADTIRRAHAEHPITAVQSELSLFTRDVLENGVMATLDELGIGFVAYSPLGRGTLSGRVRTPEDLDADDARRVYPRFAAENLAANALLIDRISGVAAGRGLTAGQISLAWVAAQGAVPIPGTKRRTFLEENAQAADVVLTDDELSALEAAVPPDQVAGDRATDGDLGNMHR